MDFTDIDGQMIRVLHDDPNVKAEWLSGKEMLANTLTKREILSCNLLKGRHVLKREQEINATYF